jgi:hypothetical protein
MDDNTKEVLVLLIPTLSTIVVAWIRMRGVGTTGQTTPNPPAAQEPPPPSGTPGV